MAPTLVLASTSPARATLLHRLNLPFEAVAPSLTEVKRASETPSAMVRRLAQEKAQTVRTCRPQAVIIGADQCAVLEGEVLGKPGDYATAFEQLRQMAGHEVLFHTGLCIVEGPTQRTQTGEECVKVVFRKLSDQQIATYLQTAQPYNCTGSLRIEGLGVALVERIEGDDGSTLIGLPLTPLIRMLERAGLQVL